MSEEREPGGGKKDRFEQLLEKAQDLRLKGAYEEALENLSQAIELAPDEPRVIKNPETFVNALAERASVYKDLGRYTEAFADLDAAEDIIGGTDKRLDDAREAIKKEREEIQKETLLKEKMRRAAGHAPITERLRASSVRPLLQPLSNTPIGRLIPLIGPMIIVMGLLIILPFVLWQTNLVAISAWIVVGVLSSFLYKPGRSMQSGGFTIVFTLGALIGGGALSLIVFFMAGISISEYNVWLILSSTLVAFFGAHIAMLALFWFSERIKGAGRS